MDTETKEYIDSKFAEADKSKRKSQEEATLRLKQREVQTKKFVYICAGILCVLLLLMIGLLAWAQFIPHSR